MAKSTLKLSTEVNEGFKTKVKASHEFYIDQPKPGGTNVGPNPLEYFLSSLGGCICAIGRIISAQRKLNVRSIHVDIEGDIDKDFLLGQTTEGRAGFVEIRANVKIDSDMTLAEKQAFLDEVEKRCPIADNVGNRSKIVSRVVE
ncbi:MAG: osmotically inducible protein C [Candidatus Delongbacteria bacterium]|nr:MAG: osmotically inducible protein C [Candidatus Delongbacteria bacterium]